MFYYYATNSFIQVAFGTNFSKDEHVKKLCGSNDLLALLNCVMEGIQLHLSNSLLPVSSVQINEFCSFIFDYSTVFEALWWA